MVGAVLPPHVAVPGSISMLPANVWLTFVRTMVTPVPVMDAPQVKPVIEKTPPGVLFLPALHDTHQCNTSQG